MITYSRREAYPNPGTGRVLESTIEANARDLEGLLDAIGLDRVHLVGHSYGGFIAAFFPAHHPGRLRSLALVEPAIASLLLRDPSSRAQGLALLLRRPRTALAAQRYLKRYQAPALGALARGEGPTAVRCNVDGVEDRPGALGQLPADVEQMMLDNARTVEETATPFPPMGGDDLQRVTVPALCVNGSSSALWLRTIGHLAVRGVPTAEDRTVPGTGHYPHVQQPAAIASAFSEFWVRCEARSH